MKNIVIKTATEKDSSIIKELINKMYGIEYETRHSQELADAIKNNLEFYTLAIINNKVIGFAGASKNKEYLDLLPNTAAVIDYIYVEEDKRDLVTSYNLIKSLFKQLIDNGYSQAILQVQNFNKQRFLHYALSDKKIIKSFPNTYKAGYEDQILLIENLNKVSNLSFAQLLFKCKKYIEETK